MSVSRSRWGTRNYQRPSLARREAFDGEGLSAKLTGGTVGKPDGPAHRSVPWPSFSRGEDPEAIREGVRVALADCEEIFRAQETHKRMKDKTAHACHALCRACVTDELQRRRGTRIGEHLKMVLSIIDRQER
jgi:hypothetical protein